MNQIKPQSECPCNIVGLIYKFHPTRCPDLEAVIYGQKKRTKFTKPIGSFRNTDEKPPGSLSEV
jgi:hypothetical protein